MLIKIFPIFAHFGKILSMSDVLVLISNKSEQNTIYEFKKVNRKTIISSLEKVNNEEP